MAECSGICPYGDVRDEVVGVGMFLSRYLNKLSPVVSPRPISQPMCVT